MRKKVSVTLNYCKMSEKRKKNERRKFFTMMNKKKWWPSDKMKLNNINFIFFPQFEFVFSLTLFRRIFNRHYSFSFLTFSPHCLSFTFRAYESPTKQLNFSSTSSLIKFGMNVWENANEVVPSFTHFANSFRKNCH